MTAGKYDHIRQLIREGKRAEARAELSAMVRADPKDADAWYGLAQVIDDPEKKRFCLEKAHQLRPEALAVEVELNQASAAAGKPAPVNKNAQTVNWIIGCLGVLAIAVIFMGVLVKQASRVTAANNAPPAPNYYTIRNNMDALTDLQWQTFYNDRVVGKKAASWVGWVSEVETPQNGRVDVRVDMDPPSESFSAADVYFTLPVEQARNLNVDQQIQFSGVIDSVLNILSVCAVDLENVTLE